VRELAQALIITAALLCLADPARASGSYTARPPKPVQLEGRTLDREQYEIGRRIFLGREKLPEPAAGQIAGQRALLERLEAQLPEASKRRARLTALAGRLNQDQLRALEHYVQTRFASRARR
jgi:hypothetical protein